MSRSNSTKRRRNEKIEHEKLTCIRSGGKIRYPNRKRALTALNNLRAPHSNATKRTAPKRVYKCPFCGDHHLTKQEEGTD